MDFDWPTDLAALARDARALATEYTDGRDERENCWIVSFDRDFSRELGRRGWLGMTWPVEVGGGGRPPIERFVVTEQLVVHGAPLASSWVADRQMGPSLVAFGTPEQQERFLPGIRSGDACWCIGMSEPDAGSDLVAIRTRAMRDGDDFVVNGAKIWTSWAHKADYCYLIARTSSTGKPHEGLSEFVVDMRSPGVTVRPILDMTDDAHFCEVLFEDVRVPAENLVGALDGSWRQLMRQLEHERGGIDRLMSNRLLFESLVARADHDDPLIRQEIAAIETGFRIGRLLVMREVLGQAPPSFSAATKLACTGLEQRVAAFGGRVDGPAATLWGRVAKAICYAPAYTIQGGTNNVLHNILAERTLGLPR
jgi:alkylation response protein AidB-like acyl-CoA dehydrogenase